MAAKVYTEHLVLSLEQKTQLDSLYSTPGYIQDTQYKGDSTEEQLAALGAQKELGLDDTSREALDDRWSIHWTNGERVKGGRENKRALYQWYVSSVYHREKSSN